MTSNAHENRMNAQRSTLLRASLRPTKWDGENRRHQEERRTYNLKTLYQCLSSPRRFNGRRSADRRFPVMDRFESGMAFLAIGLMILSIMDSVFTLTLISHGGEEINPFMNWLLHISVNAFVGVKMLLTAIPALLLVATGNVMVFGLFRARTILAAALGMYCGLILYELSLLSLIYF